MARQYSRQSVDLPSIRSVQANLILALRELLTRTSHKAWIFTGMAIRQAQVLRLGREYYSRVSNRQMEVQRRTFWACLVMDRLVSYGCWRPQMIDLDCVAINLPCPENSFAFEQPFGGHKLGALPFPCDSAGLGMLPYFIAILVLWAQATYIQIKGGRRYISQQLGSSASSLSDLETKLEDFHKSIPVSMQWSAQNLKVFRHTNQEGLFINFHFLLLNARCVMNQEYLPYPDGTASNYAEISHERQEAIIAACVYSSETTITIMNELWHADDISKRHLQSVFAAAALLSAVNTQLWLRYVRDPDSETSQRAQIRVQEVATVLESWKTQWPVADAWLRTLVSLCDLYEDAYGPNIDYDDGSQGRHDSSMLPNNVNDVQERSVARLTEGNGLPEIKTRMVDRIRFTLLSSLEDLDARERALKASMRTARYQVAVSEDYAGGFEYWNSEDLELGLPELYLDEWPGLFVGPGSATENDGV
ncbi:hypothetical protein LTR56_014364 [Elasticomyces elasticus]|nr:hypothetical protein LTR56_014364 [Elasticomyces elasticus]KAK3636347.1 hypothetical protein LTR22_018723 [Elasticomyces elasticus]KAK4916620.1 hypothetical protein LTR49_015453 [Elasticomyces elasticus]KAK5756142.1 hypothetical protein LTS12_013695 [Elasticomyces elasticus]